MEEIKCPVCGKVGIKNYHNEDIKCPCCGSDLSIFRVIDKIPNQKAQKSWFWKIVASVFVASTIFLGWYSVNSSDTTDNAKRDLSLMQDSISRLNENLKILQLEAKTAEKVEPEVYYKHVVRPGDNLWKISYRYFNTGRKYMDIAKWNNIEVNATISVGDTLIIR